MSGPGEIQDFADRLRGLKERSNRSYEALARRAGCSSSALHRYCSGAGVPSEWSVVERFAKVCGATREELRELQQAWSRAYAARDLLRSPARDGAVARDDAVARDGEQGDESRSDPSDASAASAAKTRLPLAGVGGRWSWLLRFASGIAVLSAILWAFDAAQPQTKVSSPAEPAVSGSGQRARLVGVNLLSENCPEVMVSGEKDACVVELQRLLNRAGAGLTVDGDFGPKTRMRVEAFQVLAGLRYTGLVDEETKRALYAGKVRLTTWPRERVVRRIREVFAEDPDRAVRVADCQSNLDPLFVLANPNGIRNWGLFQIYGGYTLAELGGTPERALDPEWNIQAAHRLWAKTRDFRAWQCGRAVMPYSPSPG